MVSGSKINGQPWFRDRVIMLSWCLVQRSKASTRVRDSYNVIKVSGSKVDVFLMQVGLSYNYTEYYLIHQWHSHHPHHITRTNQSFYSGCSPSTAHGGLSASQVKWSVLARILSLSWHPVQRSKASARVRERVIMLSWCSVQRSGGKR